ncbi:MAG: zinc metallopeptidase [Bacteroidaceae bacterium]|nr:zinc metallopeptidase [Bacteroidaceae bacterium]MBR6856596.1 zinc metallopeptidase [Bacteroidaceae bacterium]
MYWVLFIVIAIVSHSVQLNLDRKFKKYSQIPTRDGLSGHDVATRMLADHGLTDVRVTCVEGRLSDHYNPETNTVNLSKDVYYGRTMMAAAVAAHECGHAVQHAKNYAPVQLRSALVPVVQFSSQIVTFVLLAGILVVQTFPALMIAGIALFAMTTLFSFVTLPVEVDASSRALAWLKHTSNNDSNTMTAAQDALKAAAYTYVVAAVSSLGTLVYYIMIFLSRRR